MMRSMYSAVSGLKTHQSKMDVIGNNIANVNTVGFKGSSVTFNEIMYQTMSGASGANVRTGTGGVNAKQIGLGVAMASTQVDITSAGASQTTGRAFDLKISDKGNTTSFFVVNNGSETLFTRAGSFYVDGAGNLAMTSTGYNVMGWQVDELTGEIRKDQVSALGIMQEKNLTSPAEATSNAVCGGIVDRNCSEFKSEGGYVMNLNFFDDLGYLYTAKFALKSIDADAGQYSVELTSIYDSDNKNILQEYLAQGGNLTDVFGANNSGALSNPTESYAAISTEWTDTGSSVTVGGASYYAFRNSDGETFYMRTTQDATGQWDSKLYRATTDVSGAVTGMEVTSDAALSDIYTGLQPGASINQITGGNPPTISATGVNFELKFDPNKGGFVSVGDSTNGMVTLNMRQLGGNFSNITVDFNGAKNSNNGGTSTIGMDPGAADGTTGVGKKLGALIGLSVDQDGKIYGSYDNGNTVLLGQIAAAQFANAAGLEKIGENCYRTTLNSGDFDGIGVEISSNGSSISTGQLEMSNVDLSSEFTEMITTQRGFQANSRVITTSDTLLEELINLKR